jgi:hypothetical protein
LISEKDEGLLIQRQRGEEVLALQKQTKLKPAPNAKINRVFTVSTTLNVQL